MFSCSLRERERICCNFIPVAATNRYSTAGIQYPCTNEKKMKKKRKKEFNNYMPGTKGITPGNYELMVKSWIQANKSKRVAS
jgi:hypothetical protein